MKKTETFNVSFSGKETTSSGSSEFVPVFRSAAIGGANIDDDHALPTAPWSGYKVNNELSKKANSTALAADYSTSATYAVGDMVTYLGDLYECITAITTAEAWTAAHWTKRDVTTPMTEDEMRRTLKEAFAEADIANAVLPLVLKVKVRANYSTTTDADGVPAYSVLTIAAGGNSQNIAAAIYNTKPKDLTAFGAVSVTVEGQTIKFSRTTNTYATVQIHASGTDQTSIKSTVVDYFATVGIGEDLHVADLMAYCNHVVSGAGITEIVCVANGVSASASTGGVLICATKLAVFNTTSDRITFVS